MILLVTVTYSVSHWHSRRVPVTVTAATLDEPESWIPSHRQAAASGRPGLPAGRDS